MKILVVNNLLEQNHIDLIKSQADSLGAEVHFYNSDSEIPQSDYDTDIIYGFAPSIVNTSRNLKWLCVPWAGVDSILKPDYFANEDCILTNAAGAYGVSIAEHMIATALVMMRRLNEFFKETQEGKWLSPRPQKSLKDCRITVLGTGDIGTTFAIRARAFEPKNITGVCRSGINTNKVYDSVILASMLVLNGSTPLSPSASLLLQPSQFFGK